MKTALWTLLVALLSLSQTSDATDCKSDCRKNCTVTYSALGQSFTEVDPFCHARCITEKEIACSTGITSCDTWRVSSVTGYYAGAIKAIETANRQNWRPQDEHDCQMGIDQIASAGTAAGTGMRLYDAYKLGVSAALTVNKATVVSYLVSESIKHFLHCACSAASYVENGSSASGTPAVSTNDTYYISHTRKTDGKWAERQGPAASRQSIKEKASDSMDGKWHKTQSGYFNSQKRTLTEVDCREGRRINIQNGGTSSLSAAFKDVTDRGWSGCLFRVTNTQYGVSDIPISDRYFNNMTSSGGGWSLHHGSNSNSDSIRQKTRDGISGNVKEEHSGRYSSSRLTRTRVACVTGSSASGGLATEDSFVALHFGKGDQSLLKAFKSVNGKHYKNCTFDVEDNGFANFD